MTNFPTKRTLGGAQGTTSTGSSAQQTLAIKTKKGLLAAAAYDASTSTKWGDLYKLISMAQNGMIDEIDGFEKKGMILLKQILFASGLVQLHDHVAVEQAVKLQPDVNYVPDGGTCLYHAHYTMVTETEAHAAKLNAGGYNYNRVYLTATDMDGDNASATWGTTLAMAKEASEKALATNKVTMFYFGVGGSSVQDHVKYAMTMGIPGEFVFAIEPNTDPHEVGKWARHHFGLFSAFLKSKSVALAAGQAGPANLPGGGAWKKPTTP